MNHLTAALIYGNIHTLQEMMDLCKPEEEKLSKTIIKALNDSLVKAGYPPSDKALFDNEGLTINAPEEVYDQQIILKEHNVI